jgi:hypothetical protein
VWRNNEGIFEQNENGVMVPVCKESCIKSYFDFVNKMYKSISVSEKDWDYKEYHDEFGLYFLAVKTYF